MLKTWRRPFTSDTSHYVAEQWDSYFYAPCKQFITYVGSTRDEGAPKCDKCLKALEGKGNEQ